MCLLLYCCPFFFFNDTATTEIYTLSLHDALPIFVAPRDATPPLTGVSQLCAFDEDRKSTRLNSSHITISYAVFCLKKKKNYEEHNIIGRKNKNKKKLRNNIQYN